jgi:two-component system nitrogen regulation sensor histidine kinase NtrY
LNSVKVEFQSKFGKEENISIDKDGNKMSFYLKKFAKVFVTDINFYDPNGYLMASSRPKVFNVGLISEQMNPIALREMKMNYESEFTHQERIGNLSYSSAYMPYFNNEGEQQGFLNLQHFGQQKDFEFQIQRFLTAIINVFMLLLAVSVVIAIFVSGWLTAPLRLLQESFAKVNLGQRNERIIYTNDDEIGALVKEYNRKIDELEIKAQQLAQSERESAWREMAKQVAHEIKNPLTPMKLGLQHFERLYDPEAPMSKEKFQKVTRSLVEQIDGLTRIANEFSNFAKMPQPQRETIDICALLENVVQVFSHDGMRNIRTENTNKEINLSVDKDMMIRVFNNLIKNAFQAIQEIENGEVVVSVSTTKEDVLIEIRDNGKGIAEEQKDKIFVPYFTTKSTGTGLGLAMVKQMVELHQGDVSFVSEEGKGTSFIVRLER